MFVPAWVPGRIFKTVIIEEAAYWFNTHVTMIFWHWPTQPVAHKSRITTMRYTVENWSYLY